MPVELAVWRIDSEVKRMSFIPLNLEERLQDILVKDISVADPNLMIIGREVPTSSDKRIDILAINRDGCLVVLELKRDRTPREIIAQILDYGSWVRNLKDDDIAKIFESYQKNHLSGKSISIDKAFCSRFNVSEMPDELNETHELVIVASELDPSTERIVSYLSEYHEVNINAVFFRVFQDDGREYLSRAWFREPNSAEILDTDPKLIGDWNGEYYASYGADDVRSWEEAVKYGFISAGWGAWYTNTLSLLQPGDRIWVNIPGKGYVGVGEVTEERKPIDDFMVKDGNGKAVPLASLSAKAAKYPKAKDDPEKAEYLVRVKWLKTVHEGQAIKERGFFGNQNTVARPKTPKWEHTIERLKIGFGIQ